MSETVTEQNSTETDPVTEANPDTPTETPPSTEPESGNKEAAGYRRKLRDVEVERDALAARLDAAHTSMLEAGLKGDVTIDALTAAGHTLDTLRDDNGDLDSDLIAAAETDTATRFGITKQRTPKPDFSQGASGGDLKPAQDWEAAFKPGR